MMNKTSDTNPLPLFTLKASKIAVLAHPDGNWPLQYANRAAAEKAATKRGAALGMKLTVIHTCYGRGFYLAPAVN